MPFHSVESRQGPSHCRQGAYLQHVSTADSISFLIRKNLGLLIPWVKELRANTRETEIIKNILSDFFEELN